MISKIIGMEFLTPANVLLIAFAMTLLFGVETPLVEAQQINNPTHIPNAQRRKIMNIQLLGRVKEAEVNSDVDDALGSFLPDLESLTSVSECALNIGNTDTDRGSLGKIERDIIIAGDVINLCN